MAVLPQTQCGRCGFPGCRPYARALLRGTTSPNRCPPGGEYTRLALSAQLQCAPPDWPPGLGPESRTRVAIDPARCIGCARCLPACPVDAIVGALGQLHAVIASECTGCGLCLPPCPADCFTVLPHPGPDCGPWPDRSTEEARRARWRHARSRRRAAKRARPESARGARERKRAEIREALERVRRKRGWQGGARDRKIPPAE